jgi:hypothetical protein
MSQPSKSYQLDKSLWTDLDFDTMGWHDCMIYAISFGDSNQLLFDIDYIFKWVQTGKTYKFWVSPCTLIFENVYDIEFQIDSFSGGLQVDDISRENPRRPQNADFIGIGTEFNWNLETLQGSILFKSVGYKQHVRQNPKFINGQYFELNERGGISFDTRLIDL